MSFRPHYSGLMGWPLGSSKGNCLGSTEDAEETMSSLKQSLFRYSSYFLIGLFVIVVVVTDL